MKEIIKIETKDYRVGKKFYQFHYTVWRNGEEMAYGIYSSSHSRSATSIRKWLKNGWATELVLSQQFG